MKSFKKHRDYGFWDQDIRLSKLGDPLEKLQKEVDMAVPLSPEEVLIKRKAIYKHTSQNNGPVFPGADSREFWQRAEERNHATAVMYDKLGMAEYQAIEVFVRFMIE